MKAVSKQVCYSSLKLSLNQKELYLPNTPGIQIKMNKIHMDKTIFHLIDTKKNIAKPFLEYISKLSPVGYYYY